MSQNKSKMGLQPTLYQVQLNYLFFALAVVVYSPGVKTCVEHHTVFTVADNDLVVPPGAEEIQFAYTKPSEQVFNFELGSAGASSTQSNDPRYQASMAFTKEELIYNQYHWQWVSESDMMYADDWGNQMHDLGKHQSIFFQFNQPQTVVRIAFKTASVWSGPTRFLVFASNAKNCLDVSQWTVLKVVDDNKRFPRADPTSELTNGMRVKNLPEIGPFRCYGIQVRQVPGMCKLYPATPTSKLRLLNRMNIATINQIRMWRMEKDCKKTAKGKDYRGQISITRSGKTCQAWSETSITSSNYPLAGVTSNYCRNPDSLAEPWCFYDYPDHWENCDVPICTDCPRGQYHPSTGESCKECPAGQYQPDSGKDHCIACPTGQYQGDTGKTSCHYCPPGQYQASKGQSSCINCPAGQYQASQGQSSCNKCPANRYQPNYGRSSCFSCGSGYYQPNTGSTSCNKDFRDPGMCSCSGSENLGHNNCGYWWAPKMHKKFLGNCHCQCCQRDWSFDSSWPHCGHDND